jgi:ectoine hydroxylase-related dioxygenase (phytanoyl-CoA dioxygenase family)
MKTPLLDEEQIAAFRRDGYLKYTRPVLEDAQFSALRDHFETKLREHEARGERPEAMDKPHFSDTKLFDWVLSDSVLDLVEPLLGPDFNLFSTHFICKPSGDGRRVPWHEDSAYWKGILDPMEAVTVWLAIDPSTNENGCMCVVPSSHATQQSGFSDYQNVGAEQAVFSTEIVRPQQRAEHSVPIELQPNQASLHDARLIHGSAPNTSTIRRCGFTMRFVPAHVRLSPKWEEPNFALPGAGTRQSGKQSGRSRQNLSASARIRAPSRCSLISV